MIIKTPKQKSYLLSLTLGLLFGPLSLFYFTFWGALIITLLPLAGLGWVVHSFLDNEFLRLQNYPNSLAIWGGVYWLICILCMLGMTYEHNTDKKTEVVADPVPAVNPEIRAWLRDNPGLTLNDYYRERSFLAPLTEEEYEYRATATAQYQAQPVS